MTVEFGLGSRANLLGKESSGEFRAQRSRRGNFKVAHAAERVQVIARVARFQIQTFKDAPLIF